ncbi:uncharacterized protein K452DRAFT_55747 [Aplosporella prunicola CBS 121167]|uniref:Uncharacterized protein n=1 Tax=Aplosporella prunicola CBS 121167 TaxID=1176127 RepID=A0A6A6B8Y9_9PEZI|nr:uncharacterized protein K452DRAFT_55747 [Aplosporella prunicola CBS 121167]KAF2140426.1 hypothetical protein K452DRAFT_55747 [Aplosporella prunicola CBS 121167]
MTQSSPNNPVMAEGEPTPADSLLKANGMILAETSIPISDSKSTNEQMWTPFWLRRGTLAAFILSYILLIIGIVILLVVDRKSDGIATSESRLHYLWTYGPTAILSVLAAFWGQAEHRSKQMLPWGILRSRPSKASSTLFLDYVSETQIWALYKSLRSSHFPVVFSITVSLLIKILTLVSTGLLVLQYQTVSRGNKPVTALDSFNQSNYNLTSDDGLPLWDTVAMSIYNKSFPLGTSQKYAVPTLDFKNNMPKNNYTADIILPAFSADMACETAEVTRLSDCPDEETWEDDFITMQIHFTTPSCNFVKLWQWEDGCPSKSHNFRFMSSDFLSCNNSVEALRDGPEEELHAAFFTGRVAQGHEALHPLGELDTKHPTYLSVVVCKPSYTIAPATVSFDNEQSILSVQRTGDSSLPDQHLPDIAPINIIQRILRMTTIQGTAHHDGEYVTTWDALLSDVVNLQGVYSDKSEDDQFDSLFLILMIFLKRKLAASLMDPKILKDGLTDLFNTLAAQMAKSQLMVPDSQRYNATVHLTEQRIRVRELSFFWMLGILVVLIPLTAGLSVVAPRGVVSRDPGSIGGLATILARSHNLAKYLSGMGSAQISVMKKAFENASCTSQISHTEMGKTFSVEVSRFKESDQPQSEDAEGHRVKWWHPSSLTATHKFLVICLLVAIIVALELLLQQSLKHGGLMEVEDRGSIRYTWVYIPAAVMILVQLLVGMTGSSSNIMLVYHELRISPSTASRTLMNDPQSLLTLHAIYRSISQRHWAILAMSLALLLTPFLTIVTSGLYYAESSSATESVSLKIRDHLLPEPETDGSWEETSAFISYMLINNSISYPNWTRHGLVFPELSISSLSEAELSAMGPVNLTATVPALRPSLNCTFVQPDQMNRTYYTDDESGSFPTAEVDIYYASECNSTYISWDKGIWSIGYNASQNIANLESYTCPHDKVLLVAVYGSSYDLNATLCEGYLEQVNVETRFSLPNFDIISTNLVESTARRLPNGSVSLAYLMDVSGSMGIPRPLNGYSDLFTIMFELADNDGLRLEDLTGEKGFPKLVQQFEWYWRLMYPQVLNIGARKSSPIDTAPTLSATIIQPNHFRLQQSAASTRVLEALLGALVLCMAVSVWAMNNRAGEVLPKNPCSIGAAGSLIAGAAMLKEDVIPPGAEWCDDKELEKRGVFHGYLFSLGWWGEKGTEGRRYGVDIGKAE